MNKLMVLVFMALAMVGAAHAVLTFEDDFNDLSNWDSTPSHCYAYDGIAYAVDGYYFSSLSGTSTSVLTRSIDMSNLSDWRITTIAKVDQMDFFTFFANFIQEDCTPYGYTNNNFLYALQVEPYYGGNDVYVRMGADGVNCVGSLPPTPLPAFTLGVNHNYTQEKIGDVWSFYMDGVLIANASLTCTTPAALTQFQLFARDNGYTKVDYISFEQFEAGGCVGEGCECTPLYIPSDWSSCDSNGTVYIQTRSFTDANDCGEPIPADETRLCGKTTNVYGRTTDFEQVADPSNVADAIYETPYGYIEWQNSISVLNVDLDKTIQITADLLYLNKSSAQANMNTTANVGFQMDRATGDWCTKGFSLYYAEDAFSDLRRLAELVSEGKAWKVADKTNIGKNCSDPTVCQDVRCVDSFISFEAQHFTGFVVEPTSSPAGASGGSYTPFTETRTEDVTTASTAKKSLTDDQKKMLFFAVVVGGLIYIYQTGSLGSKRRR
jgi:hypothetical protein